jgi:hypothetical protein
MLGRTAGVVALRDGLYKACEAYANGVIGKDAYALVLSQYGNLLVALAGGTSGGSNAGGAPSAPATAVPAGIAVAVTGGAPTGSNPSSSTASAPAANAGVAQMQQEAVQGLLVTCINEFDPTVRPADQQNRELIAPCRNLIGAVVGKASELLTPAAGTPPAAKPIVAAAKPTSNPVVLELQRQLNGKCGANIVADGIYGPQTADALSKNAGKPCLLPI